MACYSFRKGLMGLVFGGLMCLQAQAAVITATATDLADTTVGQDRWQITYRIGGELTTGYAVNLLFPESAFADLTLGAVSPSLDPALLPGLGLSDSQFTLTALADLGIGDVADASLSFVRLAPFADQAFELLDDSFSVIGQGVLSIAIAPVIDVPEPATWALMGLGVAMLGRSRRRGARAGHLAPA